MRKSLYWPNWAFFGPKFWPPPRPPGQLFTGPMAEISTASTTTSQSWKIVKEAIVFNFLTFNYHMLGDLGTVLVWRGLSDYAAEVVKIAFWRCLSTRFDVTIFDASGTLHRCVIGMKMRRECQRAIVASMGQIHTWNSLNFGWIERTFLMYFWWI